MSEQSISFTAEEIGDVIFVLTAHLEDLDEAALDVSFANKEELLNHKTVVALVAQKFLTASRALERAHANQTT